MVVSGGEIVGEIGEIGEIVGEIGEIVKEIREIGEIDTVVIKG